MGKLLAIGIVLLASLVGGEAYAMQDHSCCGKSAGVPVQKTQASKIPLRHSCPPNCACTCGQHSQVLLRTIGDDVAIPAPVDAFRPFESTTLTQFCLQRLFRPPQVA